MGSLSDLLIMLAAGVLIVPAAQYLKLGSVSGFLIAGILVGPSFAGLIAQPDEIHHISQFGVVFLLFVIGMEVNPQKLWHMRSWVFGMGLLQVLISATVLSLIAIYIFSINVNSGILIGACLSLSSTAFVMQILFDKKAFHLHFGRASFAILLLQDLAVALSRHIIGFVFHVDGLVGQPQRIL